MNAERRGSRLFVGDIEIGRIAIEPPRSPRLPSGTIEIDLRFRPNWPGVWHAMAIAADDPRS